MNILDTTRSYSRTIRQAWPLDHRESAIGIDGPPVIRLFTPWPLRLWLAIKGAFQ